MKLEVGKKVYSKFHIPKLYAECIIKHFDSESVCIYVERYKELKLITMPEFLSSYVEDFTELEIKRLKNKIRDLEHDIQEKKIHLSNTKEDLADLSFDLKEYNNRYGEEDAD